MIYTLGHLTQIKRPHSINRQSVTVVCERYILSYIRNLFVLIPETDGISVNLIHVLFHRSNFLLLVFVATTTQRGQSREILEMTRFFKKGVSSTEIIG